MTENRPQLVARASAPALALNCAAQAGGGAAVADCASDSLNLSWSFCRAVGWRWCAREELEATDSNRRDSTATHDSAGGINFKRAAIFQTLSMTGRGRGPHGGRGKSQPRATGEMHTHRPHIATMVERSADGRRAIVTSTAVDTADVGVPAHFAEDIATAEALEANDFSYFLGDDGRWAEEGGADDDDNGIRMAPPPEEGLPTDESEPIDFPMKVFVENFRDETLDEWLRSEGRGSVKFHQACAGCKAANPLFRCSRQTCFGPAMFCETCIVKQHTQLPMHMIEKWLEGFFTPTTLDQLGLRIQLGHAAGTYCPKATRAHKDFVIMDTLGIRTVKLNFCGCESTVTHRQQLMRACLWPATSLDPQTCATFNAIRLFEVQNCLGKISAYDFVRSLELLSNSDGLTPPARSTARIPRYRASVPYDAGDEEGGAGPRQLGRGGYGPGELTLDCRMCPQPEKNLPEGWDKIEWDKLEEDQRYKYFLLLAADANFKLINRNVSSEERDPVVDDGTGYFCNRADYTAHIRKHVDEEEISSCSGFQAMFLANAKRGEGTEGWGTFSKNIWTRMRGLLEKYHLKINKENVRWMVPNFHLPPHKKGCHSPFSFHFLWGAGCTHGETVEQNWEFLNGAAASTKLMGLGARVVALEGLLGFHNWRRLVSHRTLLKRRMAEDIKEGRSHQAAFEALNDGLVARDAESVASWKKWVDEWETTAHVENEKAPPYEYTEKTTTLKDVRLKLASEEYTRTADGTEVEREETPSTFIGMGLDLEEAQRQLAVSIKAAGPQASTTDQLETLKRRTQLRVRLRAFRKLQMTFMPKLRRQERARGDEAVHALGHSRPVPIVRRLVHRGLDGVEVRLRMGEAEEALDGLREGLRTRTATTKFKDEKLHEVTSAGRVVQSLFKVKSVAGRFGAGGGGDEAELSSRAMGGSSLDGEGDGEDSWHWGPRSRFLRRLPRHCRIERERTWKHWMTTGRLCALGRLNNLGGEDITGQAELTIAVDRDALRCGGGVGVRARRNRE
ncbi:hypothetical protein C8F04DRAFT_1193588 [Mycena alexandri]|uniref:CxC2-like cysteine cluster KDZ transposase-associated domain-containing protein n=1 Tax=Mycena alexandri TaxID=1745969 RepID=A0AAD6SAX2_9AGAR|nr:hypothetical protein C8F04DRAFT_1193588 [Mycena alexandri]